MIEPADLADLPCVSQDAGEVPPREYLDVCTGRAQLLSWSKHCPVGECDGHPTCRPCYELAKRNGLAK